jgi:hypothetical protein
MIRKVMWLAIAGVFAGALVSLLAVGPESAKAFFAGGSLMFGSFVYGCWIVGKMGKEAPAGMAVMVTMKLPVLGLAIWALLRHFEPLSVVMGGCVVMGSVVVTAIMDMVATIRTEA